MALTTCHNCGNKISSRAKYCPRCGAPTASRTYLVNDEPDNKRGNNIAIIVLGIVAALLVGGFAAYFIIDHFSKESHNYYTSDSSDDNNDDASSTMSQDDVIAYTSQSSSAEEEEMEEVIEEQEQVEDSENDVGEEFSTPEPMPEPISDYDDAPSSGYHNMNPNSRTHHHLVGYMTDNKGNHAIELDFDCINGIISNVVYKNVKYDGIIHMECTVFTTDKIFLEGKDGSKKFTMNLNYDDNGHFSGYSMVGSKELTVTLSANCTHN